MAEFMAGQGRGDPRRTPPPAPPLRLVAPPGGGGGVGGGGGPGRGLRLPDETRLTLTEEGAGRPTPSVCPWRWCAPPPIPPPGRSILYCLAASLPRVPPVRRSAGRRCPRAGGKTGGPCMCPRGGKGGKTMTKRMLLAVLLLIVFALPAGCQKQGENRLSPPPPRPPFAHPPRQSRPPPPPPIGWGRPWRG